MVVIRGIYQRPISLMICVTFKIGKRARKRMNIRSLVRNKSLLLHIDITTLEEHFFWRPEL